MEDQKVLIKNGIPGQKVRFMIQKKRAGKSSGRILEVLEKSSQETREPVCSNFPMPVADVCIRPCPTRISLKMKERQIRELLEDALIQGGQTRRRGQEADFEWEGIHGSPIEFGLPQQNGIFFW